MVGTFGDVEWNAGESATELLSEIRVLAFDRVRDGSDVTNELDGNIMDTKHVR